VRLLTEAEWEAAAAYDANGQRKLYPWGDEEPTPELAIYNASEVGRPAPVGCCPAGAAACGALDLAGNVWEWTTSHAERYPAQSGEVVADFKQSKDFTPEEQVVPLRGGSWRDSKTNVRCGARSRGGPAGVFDLYYGRGFRVCVSPRSHKYSDS
jgi:formylglycine-generating enzyme required for sulfatase activity